MDPLSHAALGCTLAGLAGTERSSRGLAAAAALGALSPDVDAVFMPFGWDIYLRVHEIGTHTILGAIAAGGLTAAVVRPFARGSTWMGLACGGVAGALSHVGLDLVASARLRIFWPISDHQLSLPLVAMADPWLAMLLIAGAVLVVRGGRSRRKAAIALVASAIFLSIKAVLATRAVEAYAATLHTAGAGSERIVEAKWASLREWYVMDRAEGRLRVWQTSAASGDAALILSWRIAEETPTVAESRSLDTVRNFLAVHQLGFAVTIPRPANHVWVLWSDIRYCWNPDAEAARQMEPRIADASQHLACALWFGGEFGPDGRPVRQLVKVFGFTQTRPPDG